MLIATGAFLLTLVIYFKQRQKKALSYEIVASTPLLNVSEEVKNRLQIFYEGKIVQQLHLIILRIFNSGNVPIKSDEYEEPIKVCFNADPLSVEIIESDPNDVRASFSVEKDTIKINPMLLNKGDGIRVKALTSKPCTNPSITSHIVGVKRIERFAGMEQRYNYLIVIGLCAGLAGMFLGSLVSWSNILVIVGFSLALYGFYGIGKTGKKV